MQQTFVIVLSCNTGFAGHCFFFRNTGVLGHYFTVIVLLAVFRKTYVIGLIPSKLVSCVVVLATLVLLVLFNTGGFGRFFASKVSLTVFASLALLVLFIQH